MATTIPNSVSPSALELGRSICRREILEKGICEIPNFLKPDAVAKLVSKAEDLKRSPSIGFRSYENHNIFLEDASHAELGRSDASIFESTKLLINQRELSATCPELLELYQWDGMRELMERAFSLKKLYPSADPVGGVYLNFFDRGDQLGWHFDNSEYSVNLILRECSAEAVGDSTSLMPQDGRDVRPGSFMYLPDSRELFENNPDLNPEKLDYSKLVIPNLQPGTLYLFAGNRSLHKVSKNTTDVLRMNAIFTYNSRPNEVLNEYTRKKFFGC